MTFLLLARLGLNYYSFHFTCSSSGWLDSARLVAASYGASEAPQEAHKDAPHGEHLIKLYLSSRPRQQVLFSWLWRRYPCFSLPGRADRDHWARQRTRARARADKQGRPGRGLNKQHSICLVYSLAAFICRSPSFIDYHRACQGWLAKG